MIRARGCPTRPSLVYRQSYDGFEFTLILRVASRTTSQNVVCDIQTNDRLPITQDVTQTVLFPVRRIRSPQASEPQLGIYMCFDPATLGLPYHQILPICAGCY